MRGALAVGPRQQSVEAVMGTGVVPFVVDVTIVHAGAGERSLVDKHAAATGAVSGATQCRVLVETPRCDGRSVHKSRKYSTISRF